MERRILVVEDSATQAEHLRLLLEGAGYRVDCAPNGQEGLQRLGLAPPDLVISDVVMPLIDGYAFCRAMKASERTKRIPFVLLTERKTALDILKGLEAGADNFITKPFEDDVLLERVGRIFQHLELRRRGHLEVEVSVRAAGREIVINADKQQIVELLFSTFEELCRLNERLAASQRRVEEYARNLEATVEERTRQLAEAESRFRGILDIAADGIIAVDEEQRILLFNQGAERIFGYGAAEVQGEPLDVLVPPRLAQAHRQHVRAFAAGPESVRPMGERRDVLGRRRDGSEFPAEASLSKLTQGGKTILTVILRDITERRRTEDALRESEERFRGAFENSASGMALQGPDGRYLRVNRALCEMLGYSAQELLAVTHGEIAQLDDRERDAASDRQMLAGVIGSYQAEKRYLHKHGHVIWVLAAVSLLHDRDGRPLYFLTQVQDITERKQIENELRRQREALHQTEKLAAMGQLLAGVAHELNNPLSVVIGQAALLQHAVREGPAAVRAEKIARAAERCGRIVKNFLALARQRAPERQRVDLNQVVGEAVELLTYQLRVDTVGVALELAPDLPALWADPHQLHQVVVNLVTNAHHAMRDTPPPRRLTFTTWFDPGPARVHLRVADTGPGIPPELHARIFEPFFTTKAPGQGTGLGLSLCQGIVENHRGSIVLESPPGGGATFRIELPVAAPQDTAREAPAVEASRPVMGKTILVVDDETEVASVLAEMLSADGHDVETAANGALALEKLRGRTYDLIMSDLRMPELDGPGLYSEVERRDPGLCRRFVFLTGDTLGEEVREFLERTAAPSVSKPFAVEDIRRVVQQVLRTAG